MNYSTLNPVNMESEKAGQTVTPWFLYTLGDTDFLDPDFSLFPLKAAYGSRDLSGIGKVL